MDNQAPEVLDNAVAQDAPVVDLAPVSSVTDVSSGQPAATGWKASLRNDLRDSSLAKKFEDTPEGLNKALESHANLEKLLGHEKVPIPKNADDVAGWNAFNKAMGIPDKAAGYGLADADIPSDMKELTFDKNKFAEVMHGFKLTPNQAKGLWEQYVNMTKESYSKYIAENKDNLVKVVNTLRSEWGDTYDTNVELGQTVINKFSDNKEMEDYLTSTLTKDPRGIKFLAKVGNQFAENKMGDFTIKRFSLAPDEAANELAKIRKDPNHAYLNEKATDQEHQAAIDYVNRLEGIVAKARG